MPKVGRSTGVRAKSQTAFPVRKGSQPVLKSTAASPKKGALLPRSTSGTELRLRKAGSHSDQQGKNCQLILCFDMVSGDRLIDCMKYTADWFHSINCSGNSWSSLIFLALYGWFLGAPGPDPNKEDHMRILTQFDITYKYGPSAGIAIEEMSDCNFVWLIDWLIIAHWLIDFNLPSCCILRSVVTRFLVFSFF